MIELDGTKRVCTRVGNTFILAASKGSAAIGITLPNADLKAGDLVSSPSMFSMRCW